MTHMEYEPGSMAPGSSRDKQEFGRNETNIIRNQEEIKMLSMQEKWDKTFEKSPLVEHTKVSFPTRFGTELAADLYMPKDRKPFGAVAVSGPFGAVKEQASGLYAQKLAENGLMAMAFDPSFTGESSGTPRNVNSPDINTEDFQAAVDYLLCRGDVSPDQIGILGICGWGGMALNAAALDTRVKATVASTMYDMSDVTTKGYFNADDSAAARKAQKEAMNQQRLLDFKNGTQKRAGGVADIDTDTPWFVKDYYDYYRTKRGYHSRSLNSNEGWNVTAPLSLMNTSLLTFADEIESPVLLVHGDKAHSRYFSEEAFTKLKGDNKHLLIVEDAVHTDLYDNLEKIPMEEIVTFYRNAFPSTEKRIPDDCLESR